MHKAWKTTASIALLALAMLSSTVLADNTPPGATPGPPLTSDEQALLATPGLSEIDIAQLVNTFHALDSIDTVDNDYFGVIAFRDTAQNTTDLMQARSDLEQEIANLKEASGQTQVSGADAAQLERLKANLAQVQDNLAAQKADAITQAINEKTARIEALRARLSSILSGMPQKVTGLPEGGLKLSSGTILMPPDPTQLEASLYNRTISLYNRIFSQLDLAYILNSRMKSKINYYPELAGLVKDEINAAKAAQEARAKTTVLEKVATSDAVPQEAKAAAQDAATKLEAATDATDAAAGEATGVAQDVKLEGAAAQANAAAQVNVTVNTGGAGGAGAPRATPRAPRTRGPPSWAKALQGSVENLQQQVSDLKSSGIDLSPEAQQRLAQINDALARTQAQIDGLDAQVQSAVEAALSKIPLQGEAAAGEPRIKISVPGNNNVVSLNVDNKGNLTQTIGAQAEGGTAAPTAGAGPEAPGQPTAQDNGTQATPEGTPATPQTPEQVPVKPSENFEPPTQTRTANIISNVKEALAPSPLGKQVFGGFLAFYVSATLGHYLGPSLSNIGSFYYVTPDIAWNDEKHVSLTSEYLASRGIDSSYLQRMSVTNTKLLPGLTGSSLQLPSGKASYAAIGTNAAFNIFAVRDLYRQELAQNKSGAFWNLVKGSGEGLVTALGVPTFAERYGLADYSNPDSPDNRLVKKIYLAVFKENGTAIDTRPVPIGQLKKDEYFPYQIECSNQNPSIANTRYTWMCDFSALDKENLAPGKYVAGVFVKLDPGIFMADDSMWGKMRADLARNGCDYSRSRGKTNYCLFFKEIVSDAQLKLDLDTQRSAALDQTGAWSNFKASFSGPFISWWNSWKGKGWGEGWFARASNSIVGGLSSTVLLPFSLVGSVAQGGIESAVKVVYNKAQENINATYTTMQTPENKVAVNAMLVGLPMFEEFEVGTSTVQPPSQPAKQPAASQQGQCPSITLCLACLDKKMVNGVFGDGKYVCSFPASATSGTPNAAQAAAAGSTQQPTSFDMSTVQKNIYDSINSLRASANMPPLILLPYSDSEMSTASVVTTLAYRKNSPEQCGIATRTISNESSISDCFMAQNSKSANPESYSDITSKNAASVAVKTTQDNTSVVVSFYLK